MARLVKEITGRVALCLVLLTFSAILFVYMLLLASSSLAQSGGETTGETTGAAEDQYAPGPDEECPGAEIVQTTSGTGSKQTAPFEIVGDRFRVTATVVSPNPPPVFIVDISRRNGIPEQVFTVEDEGTESTIVNAGPGTFFLDILAIDANYTVVVEDCVGNGPGNADNTDDGVIDDTIPGKPLPHTGGIPPILIAGFALLCAGSVILRAGIRRED
jgi:hypothetical protein